MSCISPAPFFPPLAKSDLNWLQSESDCFQLSVRFGRRVFSGLLRSRYRAGTNVFPRASMLSQCSFSSLFSVNACFSCFPDVLNSCSRGFRRVSGGASEGFPRGFRGFPRVSATSRTARTVGISDFQPPKKPGVRFPFIILNGKSEGGGSQFSTRLFPTTPRALLEFYGRRLLCCVRSCF